MSASGSQQVIAMEQVIVANRYKTRLAHALALACTQLDESERQALLWRYEDGLSLRRIAESLGTGRVQTARMLEQVRNKLRDSVICRLSTEEGMSGCAIAECLKDMVENPYHAVSLLDCIKAGRARRKPPMGERRLYGAGLWLVKSYRPNAG